MISMNRIDFSISLLHIEVLTDIVFFWYNNLEIRFILFFYWASSSVVEQGPLIIRAFAEKNNLQSGRRYMLETPLLPMVLVRKSSENPFGADNQQETPPKTGAPQRLHAMHLKW
ncbi:MAG: hypothetical protein Q7S37_00270 [bacterium]|nr:hypothetical protein [bacterium]